AQLLRSLGVVKGTERELREAAREFKGHALALTLLGRYLSVVHGGEIRKRDLIPALEAEEEQGGHAKRVMKAYEVWLKGKPELDILKLLGLFDRPAEGGAIEMLREKSAIEGLTESLCDLTGAEWNYALQHLRDLRLLDPKVKQHPDTLDEHPLVREYFGAELKMNNPAAWKEAHLRLYRYYRDLPQKQYGRFLPETLVEMEPLFRAVAHGCQAGKHEQSLDEVYWRRISRGLESFVTKQLGAYGADLTALTGAFKIPWNEPVDGLTSFQKAMIFSWAGFCLRGLGRLREAEKTMQAGLQIVIEQSDWLNSARGAGNLSELLLALGNVTEAVRLGQQGVGFAEKCRDWFSRVVSRSDLADALHQAGENLAAERLFREAEEIQKGSQPQDPFLTSVQGYQFCDLLLSSSAFQQVEERANTSMENARRTGALLDVALNHISISKAALHPNRASDLREIEKAVLHANRAVDGLREAGAQHHLPRGLLARAQLLRTVGDITEAWRDLEEMQEIAERGEMRLFLADFHLEAARLSLAENDPPKAREHQSEAKRLVEETAYGRRRPEVAELENLISLGE
ncbi:MAG: hypothetical protein V2A74_06330, partial [bacterium]